MAKKWTPVRVGAWCVVVVAVLGGCHAAKSRDAEFVPFPERVSIEEYISRQLPEISRMAVPVAAETGGELTVMGLPYVQVWQRRYPGVSGGWLHHGGSVDVL